MSDNFNGKDYGDYFKSLEERVNKTNTPSPQRKEENKSQSVQYKSSGKYRVIKLNYKAIMAFILILAISVTAITVAVYNKKDGSIEGILDVNADQSSSKPQNTKPKTIEYKITEATETIPLTNDAQGVIIVDTDTHKVIAERDSDKRLYPASTTKIMTLLVACENIKNYDDTFTMTRKITDALYVRDASVAGFLIDEVITVTDMLYGLILPSGGDAAVGLATKLAGSEEEFVKLMNKRAKELGLKDTNFVNTSGLFHKEHYTTPRDMAVILETAIKNPVCKKILSTSQYTTSKTPQHPEGIPLTATLFTYINGDEPETATIIGGKTGFVNESGYCIATYGINNETNNSYIVVTMKNSARKPAMQGQIELYKQFIK